MTEPPPHAFESTPQKSGRVFVGLLLPPVLLLMAIVARGVWVARNPESLAAPWIVAVVTMHNDVPIFAAVCALLWVASRWLRRSWLMLFRAGLAVFLLLFITDVVMIGCLNTRLSWGRLMTFGALPDVVFGFLRDRFGVGTALALVLAVVAVGGLVMVPRWRRDRFASRALLVGATLGLAATLVPRGDDYVQRWMRENLVMLNRPGTQKLHYSRAVAQALVEKYEEGTPVRTVQRPPDRRDVILLLIESWSSYQSKAFGGVRDWSPELDKVAEAHTRFTRFHAGGYCTAEGLVHIFGGVQAWLPYGSDNQLDQLPTDWVSGETLPRVFDEAGYLTAFMTTGPLSFVGKGVWLKRIGFESIEGGENAFYRDWPRVSFYAATDEALYKRTLQWLGGRPRDRPVFLTVETVSSHIPYIDPATETINVEACFRYADHWAAWFVRQLEAEGYFKHGILLITGDHRAMVPVLPEEKAAFGLGFSSRVPMVLVDEKRPAGEKIDWLFKQSDLIPSFHHWLGRKTKLDALSASLFEDAPNPENVALHRRGNERGLVDVLFADGEGQVRVAGDATDFVWAQNISEKRRARVLSMIAYERLSLAQDPLVHPPAIAHAGQ